MLFFLLSLHVVDNLCYVGCLCCACWPMPSCICMSHQHLNRVHVLSNSYRGQIRGGKGQSDRNVLTSMEIPAPLSRPRTCDLEDVLLTSVGREGSLVPGAALVLTKAETRNPCSGLDLLF